MAKTNKVLIIIASVLVIIAVAVLFYFVSGNNSPKKLSLSEVKTGDITEKINLNGSVKASQGVDLAFEIQGKIVANYVKVGDKIYNGQKLLAIDSSLLQAQLKQAEAQLNALDIDTTKNKLDSSLQTLYTNSLSSAQKSVSIAKEALLTASDIQYAHFQGQNQENFNLQSYKAKAVYSLLGQPDAGLWSSEAINKLDGGVFGLIQTSIINPTQSNIDTVLAATQKSLQDVKNLLDAIPIDSSLTTTERNNIGTIKTNINLEIITTSSNIQSIASQRINNSSTIETTEAQIQAAQANIEYIKAQISKTVLRALFDGQVDKDDIVVGQIVSQNVPAITISNNNLEISTNVPEINLIGTKVGNKADVTLDAFGNSINFPAIITSVDLSPSIVNGISVYKAKLKFETQDDRIKPGMTANITIISGTHSNVLTVPRSAVIQNNNEYSVIVDNGNGQRETRKVTIGFEDDTNTEITSGLKLGEKIFAY